MPGREHPNRYDHRSLGLSCIGHISSCRASGKGLASGKWGIVRRKRDSLAVSNEKGLETAEQTRHPPKRPAVELREIPPRHRVSVYDHHPLSALGDCRQGGPAF